MAIASTLSASVRLKLTTFADLISYWTGDTTGKAISQPRRMPHEVLDRDRPLERRKVEPTAVDDADLHARKGRDVQFETRSVITSRLLDKHHRDRNDRFVIE